MPNKCINNSACIKGLYALGMIALALPVLFTIQFARSYALSSQIDLTRAKAKAILMHISELTDQIATITGALDQADHDDPCSRANVQLMRRLLVSNEMLLDVGWMRDNWLVCSALQDHPYDMGPPTFVTAKNRSIRTDSRHPLDPGISILATTDRASGYTAMVHFRNYLFAEDEGNTLSRAILSKSTLSPFVVQGKLNDSWTGRIQGQPELTFVADGAVVSWVTSDKWDYGILVATPHSDIYKRSKRLLLWLVPVTLVATALLMLVLYKLTKHQTSMAAGISAGLARGEFRLVYQPIVDLHTGRWVGAEALVRWRQSGGEEVSPAVFIPVAEEAGLIEQVTRQVMELFTHEAPALLAQYPDFYIGLNMSAVDLVNEKLPAALVALSRRSGVPSERIHIEATETAFLDAQKATQQIQAIRVAGFKVAIDDFGTGYSSLSHLTKLQVDALKIDKHFVDTIGTDSVTSHVVDTIIELGKGLGLDLIAEGVEASGQAHYLANRGVRYAQGYFFPNRYLLTAWKRSCERRRLPPSGTITDCP